MPSLNLRVPLLMLVKSEQDEDESSKDEEYMEIAEFTSRFMFHVCEKKLGGAPHKRCMGAKFGWLAIVDDDLEIRLIHPFSNQKLHLPPCTFDHLLDPNIEHGLEDVRTLTWKVALSANPLEKITGCVSSECVVMGIFSDMQMLAYARLNDRGWTRVGADHDFEDVIHFKGKFYTIDIDGVLFVCDIINDGMPRFTQIASVEAEEDTEKFLLESSGDLFLVMRGFPETPLSKVTMGGRPNCWPHDIWVFKLIECSSEESGYEFERVQDLGNAAFLLGPSSVSLLAPGIKGCFKRNRIFIVDDSVYERPAPICLSVYDVGDGTFESYDFSKLLESSSLSPFWYI